MSDLICAIATPLAPSAIGILRLSGEGAVAAVDRLFTGQGGIPLSQRPAGKLTLGLLRDGEGNLLDQVQAVRYTSGYTGEESAELYCHGSPVALTLAMDALCAQGARPAGPGEFTKRAFLNGKLDLTRAEAVIDLIDAETPAAARNAVGQLTGALERRVEGIADTLTDLAAHFCAVLDYPDEDLDPFTVEGMKTTLNRAGEELSALLATYRRGRALTKGIPCAIVGAPNAGKSSLLNALLGYERAIVTSVPGTTRDTVEETVHLGGVMLRLIDTAGLRETDDPVEQIGVERSRAALEGAELILVLVDGSKPPDQADFDLVERAMALAPTILVWTKADLPSPPVPVVSGELPARVQLSAKTGQGLCELEQEVAALFPHGGGEHGSLLTNQRQADAARRAMEAVNRGREALMAGLTPDAALSDVEEALAALGELTGKCVTEEVTGRIFARFCVGK